MEAVIVALFALVVIVLVDAGYWIAISLMRRAPSLIVGGLAGWLAHRHGLDGLEAVGLGLVACLVARHVTRTRFIYDRDDPY